MGEEFRKSTNIGWEHYCKFGDEGANDCTKRGRAWRKGGMVEC